MELEEQLSRDQAAGEQVAAELRACAQEEAEIQTRLRTLGEAVTAAEVAAQRLRDQAAEAAEELSAIAERLERPLPRFAPAVATGEGDSEDAGGEPERTAAGEAHEQEEGSEAAGPISGEEEQALQARVERLTRRREQLGPVNPLAQEEYAEAVAHVEELEARRTDLETALRELRTVIRDTDRQIARDLRGDVRRRGAQLRGARRRRVPRRQRAACAWCATSRLRAPCSAGRQRGARRECRGPGRCGRGGETSEAAADAEAELERAGADGAEEDMLGVEIEITPAGKSTKRLSLLSGGEKSMTALAFLFAVFLARPCPFYILDEVEAALDDLNLDRFLALLRRYSDRAQFIVITHQKRTMEAADWLYGVSMGGDGVSKVLSRRLPPEAVGSDGGDGHRAMISSRRPCRSPRSPEPCEDAIPMPRDWSELFITDAPIRARRRPPRPAASPARAVPTPARQPLEDPRGARRRDPGDAVRHARRRRRGNGWRRL